MKRYTIVGLAENCPLCIDGDSRKGSNKPMFLVSCEGGYSGSVCAAHLAALIKAEEKPETRPQPRPEPAKPAVAVLAGNAVAAK